MRVPSKVYWRNTWICQESKLKKRFLPTGCLRVWSMKQFIDSFSPSTTNGSFFILITSSVQCFANFSKSWRLCWSINSKGIYNLLRMAIITTGTFKKSGSGWMKMNFTQCPRSWALSMKSIKQNNLHNLKCCTSTKLSWPNGKNIQLCNSEKLGTLITKTVKRSWLHSRHRNNSICQKEWEDYDESHMLRVKKG